MPIFEYRCQDCGAQFEKIVRSERERVVCKSCESRKVQQLLSVFAVSGGSASAEVGATPDSGACPCGAPRRGMCGG